MKLLSVVLPLMLFAPLAAKAQQSPVVLELFTSQGCTSCPPADALLSRLAEKDGVIALAFHIDYWDYLGWSDSFAQHAFTLRQKAYARALRQRSLFTPQVVVQGRELLVGSDDVNILSRIEAHSAAPTIVDLDATRQDGELRIQLSSPVPVGPTDIEFVAYLPSAEVVIEAGENAGQTITYTNIVTDWRTVARWDGISKFDVTFDGISSSPLVVIVQSPGMGPILTAAKLPGED